MNYFIALLSFFTASLWGETFYEGTSTFRNYGVVDLSWMQQLLPYNPIIVDVGAYHGTDACRALKIWPRSRVFALEPNPYAFVEMEKQIRETASSNIKTFPYAISDHSGIATLYLGDGELSSLLPPANEYQSQLRAVKFEVPCLTLEDWCQMNGIDHIDLLRLELEGFELQALQGTEDILKTVKIITVQSFFAPYRTHMTNYFYLKEFLYNANFVVLAHWYTQGGRGKAVYVSRELFDAYFVKCLGLGTGGLSYP